MFDALSGQINMRETRSLTYTRDIVIQFVNQMVIERGGYHSDIYNMLIRGMEEDTGNPQLQDE